MPKRHGRATLPAMVTASPTDSVLEALDRAPFVVPDDVPAEELAEVRGRAEAIRTRRVETIEHGEIQRAIAGMGKLAG
jgi:hypothetical protein